ncbi:GABA permease [Paraburkholderia domus]|jgi:Gamma-aminobutyrate permease and related permeases|uniref:amino acid permease n=1 Tax=Paraburkholderia domus TaxID=2793075 RepID=UPI0019140E12|nr:amino acid permease [Paraburkholderia domus]MBK5053485.1 amino acid permease [Burkholderia sp. R-70006]MBK5090349.1 amino acid permease [Burkholderia sp. R-69927]MBK5124905.1 amino acid permease [Burkholderia sp. R-69980]MBK5184631.1 amino acid permease [Burkholderia sp. R-69749]MCI0148747.1 amino acid permease [Paraburkholderia sediminicola]
MEVSNKSELKTGLKERHMTMIALGGVIGAGLFVGSGVVVQQAGPAAVLSFLITGGLIVLVMRMLGEMACAMPAVGSFYEYARLAFAGKRGPGKLAGFLTGWMYWYFWVIVVAVEAVAGAKLVQFWLPDTPAWAISLVLLVVLTATNLISVGSYGEFEFWFASIKVAAIVVFLFLGGLYVLGLWPASMHTTAVMPTLLSHGGLMPKGIGPVLSGAVAATGFYFGAEIVTIAAAEAHEPVKAVAKATNSVITRVLIFYVGSILLVVALVPWNSPGMATPYVSALDAMGIPAAANVMNAIVLTAVLSALNSGLYAASRMMFALTRHGDAPAGLAKVNRRGVPVRAIVIGTLFGYVSVIMSYVSPDTVFAFLVNSYGTVAIFVYVLIAVSQLKLRARLEREAPEKLRVRMWCYPYLTWFAIVGMIGILVAMAFIPDQRTPLWLGVVSLGVLLVAYAWRARKRGAASTEPEFVDYRPRTH